MKPLARWTIGCVLPHGIDVLRSSVRSFHRLYPEYDIIICWNNLDGQQLNRVKLMGFEMHEQKESDSVYPLCEVKKARERSCKTHGMPGWGWKLSPPRLRIEAHELWADNDIIFVKEQPTLTKWVRSDACVIARCENPYYGTACKAVSISSNLFRRPCGSSSLSRSSRCCE